MKLLCYSFVLMSFLNLSQAFGNDFFVFSPAEIEGRSSLPRCKVTENMDWIRKTLKNLKRQGFEKPEYEGEGQFCYFKVIDQGLNRTRSQHCLVYQTDQLWVVHIGERSEKMLPTQKQAFIEAAYLHAEKRCIFPFTFYIGE